MAKVISIINNKGGVGKTTAAISIAGILAYEDLGVALIDNDPQGNVGSYLRRFTREGTLNMSDVYNGSVDISQIRKNISYDNFIKLFNEKNDRNVRYRTDRFDLYPSNNYLNNVIDNKKSRDYFLQAINKLHKETEIADGTEVLKYDYIIIDNGPHLGFLTKVSIIASDLVLIPTTATQGGISGILNLLNLTESIITELQKRVKVRVFVNDYQDHQTFKAANLVKLRNIVRDKLYDDYIPRNTHLEKTIDKGLPINLFEKLSNTSSPGAKHFRKLVTSIIMDTRPDLLKGDE